MRILVISQFFPPDITAAAFRIGEMSQLLADRGHEVRILTSHPHKAQASNTSPLQDNANHAEVFRSKLFPVGPGGAKRYILHYLSFVLKSSLSGILIWLRGWKPDAIWASSPPLFIGITARFLSILFRCPLVLEIRDIWPDTAVAAGQLPGSGFPYRVGKSLELYLYSRASRILCVAKPMQKRIQEQTETPVKVAYNGILRGDVSSVTIPPPASAHSGMRSILYAGNLGHLQELDLLVHAFSQLVEEGELEGWRLRLLGSGAQEMQLRSQIADSVAKDQIVMDPPVSREEAAKALIDADLLYLNLKKSDVLEKTIPSKLFDYLLACRPIIGGILGEGTEILNSTGANIAFEPGELSSVKEAIFRAVQNYEQLEGNADSNRNLVLEQFTRERAVETLIESLEEACSSRKR